MTLDTLMKTKREESFLSGLGALVGGKKVSEPAWLSSYRENAYRKLDEKGLPTRKWESWKYINLNPVIDVSYQRFISEKRASRAEELKGLLSRFKGPRLVFLDGHYLDDLTDLEAIQHSVDAGNLKAGLADGRGAEVFFEPQNSEENPFALINAVGFDEGFRVRVKSETKFGEPLHLFVVHSGENAEAEADLPRILIELGRGAKANIVCHYVGLKASKYLCDAVCDIRLAQDAGLDMVVIQKLAGGNSHFLTTRVSQSSGSRFTSVVSSSGGDIIKNDTIVNMMGDESSCDLSGLSLLSGESKAFHEVVVNHRLPRGLSRQFYKNILAGKAQAEFDSLSHVFRDAQKSDSGQLNKNLLLSPDARVYARPKLKIYADDVSANHGSATGKVEKTELFYLQSRGFSADEARFLLTYGFADEVLQKIQMTTVRKALEDDVRADLARLLNQQGFS